MRSAVADPDMATSYPAAIAARAIVVPTLPAPTMPTRRSPVTALDTGLSRLPGRGLYGWNGGNRLTSQQRRLRLNPFESVELVRRQPLFVRHSSGGVGQ